MPLSVVSQGPLEVLKSEHGQNTVVELGIDGGKKLTVMVRDYAYHPVVARRSCTPTSSRSSSTSRSTSRSPSSRTGKAIGVVARRHPPPGLPHAPVRCLPEQIPASSSIDVTALDLGESRQGQRAHAPRGRQVRLPAEQTVVASSRPRRRSPRTRRPRAAGAALALLRLAPGAALLRRRTALPLRAAGAARRCRRQGREGRGKDKKK